MQRSVLRFVSLSSFAAAVGLIVCRSLSPRRKTASQIVCKSLSARPASEPSIAAVAVLAMVPASCVLRILCGLVVRSWSHILSFSSAAFRELARVSDPAGEKKKVIGAACFVCRFLIGCGCNHLSACRIALQRILDACRCSDRRHRRRSWCPSADPLRCLGVRPEFERCRCRSDRRRADRRQALP